MSSKSFGILTKSTLVYTFGGVGGKFLNFLLIPVFTRYLTPEDYGIVALIGIAVSISKGVFSLGTGVSLTINYFDEKNLHKRDDLIWNNFLILLIANVILLIIIIPFSNLISQLLFGTSKYEYLIIISFFILSLSSLLSPFMSYLRFQEKSKTYVIFTIITTLISLTTSVYLIVVQGRGINGLFEGSFIGTIVHFCLVLFFVGRHLRVVLNKRYSKSLLILGFPAIFSIGTFFIIDFSDRALIQFFHSTDNVGLYAMGYNFGLVMDLLIGGFGNAWSPFSMSYANKLNEARTMFGKIFKYYMIIFGFITLLFFASAELIVTIMTPPQFHTAYEIIGWIALSYMLKGCYWIFITPVYIKKKTAYPTIIEWAAAVINLGLNFILIPTLINMGAAYATFLSYLSLSLFALILGRRFLKVDFEWKKILTLIMMMSVGITLIRLRIFDDLLINFVFNLILLIIFGVSSSIYILDNSERVKTRNYLLDVVTQIRSKK